MRKLRNEELGRLSPEEFHHVPKLRVTIVLDDIRSLHNVGSCFRTGDAFMVEKIILCGITGTPPNREIHKTALGATETVAWEYHQDAHQVCNKLRAANYDVIAVEQADQSISLLDYKPDEKRNTAFVFGNEVFGVKEEIVKTAARVVEIPQFGTKHSLNVAVSIGIVLWDYIVKKNRG